MRTALQIVFSSILIVMVVSTIHASLDRNVVDAAIDLWADPWGRATILDAYFGFVTFLVWVCYKERSWLLRAWWILLVLALGNIAMAIYVLRELARMKSPFSWRQLLAERTS